MIYSWVSPSTRFARSNYTPSPGPEHIQLGPPGGVSSSTRLRWARLLRRSAGSSPSPPSPPPPPPTPPSTRFGRLLLSIVKSSEAQMTKMTTSEVCRLETLYVPQPAPRSGTRRCVRVHVACIWFLFVAIVRSLSPCESVTQARMSRYPLSAVAHRTQKWR